ncbi:hypothetical protein OCU04_003610 [Sclerotinia nivalis]|uniref:Aminoglycoside phosphotransferase domain-containing protein n=1 Tax=Sclerotinia nivalis TaxID=352851 RepID=A0A9X0AT68_9HELO|nr:hypothetical protein OCU04_003610 [Sclerotinia nivalis]
MDDMLAFSSTNVRRQVCKQASLQGGISAKTYITNRIDRKIERALRHDYPGGDVESCRRQLALLEEFWDSALDMAPHVLIHGDLSDSNIIVDGDANVKKIIDLGWSDMVPLQFAAVYPRFLAYQPHVFSNNEAAVGWPIKNTSIMMRDRAFYLDCIRQCACSDGGIALDF